MNRKIRKISRCATVALMGLGIATATVLPAQTVPDDETPDAGLDLPKNLQIFGDADPNVRKPTAIVNNAVITGTDVDQRLAMVAALNHLEVTDKDRQQFRLQVLRSLIDETLEVQDAAQNDIKVTSDEISQSYNGIAKRFGKTPQELDQYLRSVGSSSASLQHQIQGELAWHRLLQRRVEPFVNVGDKEVQAILGRMESQKGTEEYHLKEIYLNANSSDAQQKEATVHEIAQKLREGVPFDYLAHTYSDATTRNRGGDLDWVRPSMLPPQLVDAVQKMTVGQIAGPIQVPGGFSLLYLVDKRQILTADPRDSVLSLRQMTLTFPANTTEAQAQAKAAELAKATQSMAGCGDVPKVAQKVGAQVVDNDSVRVRDLPPQLQEIMINMKVGQSTPPFGSPDQGVRVLTLCGRDDPKTASLPSADDLQSQLEEQRVNLRAQQMLRDLRRDAIIEYR